MSSDLTLTILIGVMLLFPLIIGIFFGVAKTMVQSDYLLSCDLTPINDDMTLELIEVVSKKAMENKGHPIATSYRTIRRGFYCKAPALCFKDPRHPENAHIEVMIWESEYGHLFSHYFVTNNNRQWSTPDGNSKIANIRSNVQNASASFNYYLSKKFQHIKNYEEEMWLATTEDYICQVLEKGFDVIMDPRLVEILEKNSDQDREA